MLSANNLPILSRNELQNSLTSLGLRPEMTLLVHSSLKSIGNVIGGPLVLIEALCDLLSPSGSLAMPTNTDHLLDPALWQNPPLPPELQQKLREEMPAFDPALSPSSEMGIIPEYFRKSKNVLRSSHPLDSFAAWGKHARFITENHSLEFGMGEQSPLARLYDLNSYVLLIGVGYDKNTCFHLGEYRAKCRPLTTRCAPILENGQRVWKSFIDMDFDDSSFAEIGKDFEVQQQITIGKLGLANCRLFSLQRAVDFAQSHLGSFKDSSETFSPSPSFS